MMSSQHQEATTGPEAGGAGIVDFSPRWLAADASMRDAHRWLAETVSWGVPLVGRDSCYVGMLTLRSLMTVALPVAVDDALLQAPLAGIFDRLRLDRILDRPAAQHLDLEVPVVRLSTRLPQLLAALCRRSPVVPIISDTGMRLVGIASLDRAAKALYGR